MDLTGDLAKLKVVDLKQALAERGLDTKGIKAVLVSRLEAALAEEGKNPSANNIENNAETAVNESPASADIASTPAKTASRRRSVRSKTRSPSPIKKVDVPETPLKTLPEEPDEELQDDAANQSNVSTMETENESEVKDNSVSLTTPSNKDDAKDKCPDNADVEMEENRGEKRDNEEEGAATKKRASSVEPHADDFTKEEDEPEINDDNFLLSWYDSDIHLKIDQSDFLKAKPISDAGLNLVWAGARGNYGITEGKIAYEVHLSNYNRTNHNQDEKRMHEFRCGWSTNDTSLQLGESEFSYGYDTNAKKCTDCKFEEYGKRYGLHDVVGVYLDLDSSPCKIEYTLNGESLGTAFEFEKTILSGKALYPHISTKNVGFAINFGAIHPSLYSTVPVKPKDNRRAGREKRKNAPKSQKVEEQKESGSEEKKEEKLAEDSIVEPMEAEKEENPENTENEGKADVAEEQNQTATTETKEATEEKTGSLEILPSYSFLNTIPISKLTAGPRRPDSREQCEVLMMIGLPGTGKTYWARNHVKENPEKRYNAFGVAFLLEKMRVNGEARKPNNSFRWSNMVESLSRSLNILHNIACRRRRNYIIDQPNVYANLQRRKMSRFGGFFRKAVVVFPTEDDHKDRSSKRLEQQGKEYSPANVEEMHAKFSIPILDHQWFNEIIFSDLNEDIARENIKKINEEGTTAKNKRKAEREVRAKQRSRQFQGSGRNGPSGGGMWGSPMRGGNWDRRPGEGYGYGRPPRDQWSSPNWMRGGNTNFRRGPSMGGNFQRRDDRRPNGGTDPKRQKMDQGAWGGNWNSFGGGPGGFQQNNAWAQPVWSRGHSNANGTNYGGGNWWQ